MTIILSRDHLETAVQVRDDLTAVQLAMNDIHPYGEQNQRTAERLAGILRMLSTGLDQIGLPTARIAQIYRAPQALREPVVHIRPADQEVVNTLRIDLATAMIELSGMHVADIHSQQVKSGMIDSLRRIDAGLNAMGMIHINLQEEHRHVAAGENLPIG